MKMKTINAMGIMAKHTIDIKILKYKQFKIRLLIGSKIVKFGTWIMGCKSEIKTDVE